MTRELQDFYTLGSDCLWITFADGRLWWAFAEPMVERNGVSEGRGARSRRTIDAWRSTNILGEPLRTDALSSKLTQTAAYRQTLCRAAEADYLLRRINGVEEPIITELAPLEPA